MKFHKATRTQRKLFVSDRFAHKHGELMNILREACAMRGSKWVLHRDVAEFVELFKSACRTHRQGYFGALLASNETQDTTRKTHT